jgi:thiol-disulfide isomerase/thioredoxin
MFAIAPLLFWAWLNNESPLEKADAAENTKKKAHDSTSQKRSKKRATKKLTKDQALETLFSFGFSELPALRLPTLIISMQKEQHSGFQGINFLDAKKPVLLHFWATWCGPCKRELPAFAEFISSQDVLDAYTITSELRTADPAIAEKIWNYYNNNKIEGLNVCADIDASLASLLDVSGIPVTFLISSEGLLLGRFLGAVDWANPAFTDALLAYIQ